MTKIKKKLLFLLLISSAVGLAGKIIVGLTTHQSLILSVFLVSILGTLFFWDFRLSFVFMGSGVLFLIHAMDLESFIKFASLDVILFLIGMMVIVAMMKEAGFFSWLITVVLRIRGLNGTKIFIIIMVMSALLSGLMGEVSSIMVMIPVIFGICDFLEVSVVPLAISSVLATNIGSASTILGNPIGVLIAVRGGLTFEDFIIYSLPICVVVLILSIWVLIHWYREYVDTISHKLKAHGDNEWFRHLISIPPDYKTRVSMVIFGLTVFSIAFHKRLELIFALEENTMLIMLPIIYAGIVLLYRNDKARYYIENEVEWNSLLFFLFLFAQAGVLQASGVANISAQKIIGIMGRYPKLLGGMILISSGVLSSILDNIVVVASYVPVVQSMDQLQLNSNFLWWSILFGACFGGNITLIGSTANIIALGLLEKNKRIRIGFREWFRIGIIIGITSMIISYLVMITVPGFK
ncbi:MAG: hypothetical protein JW983_01860 [Elusimicrobia bacterium]|nr:hypothetical protein [Elusimicrobiota bacterium]